MNSVNFENGKKFHQSRDEMLQAKEYSNQLCREYGLSVTETKTKNPRNARWKRDLIETASYAIGWSATKEEFIEYMREHGYENCYLHHHHTRIRRETEKDLNL